jgi:hypothetical protein
MKSWPWILFLLLIWACKPVESLSKAGPAASKEAFLERADTVAFYQASPDLGTFSQQGFRSTKEGEIRRLIRPESHIAALTGKRNLRLKTYVPWRVQKPQGEQTAAVVFGILALVVGIAAMLGGFFILVMGVLALAGGDASALWQWGLWLTLAAGGGIVLSILNLAFSYARLTGTEGLGWAALGMNMGAITIGLLVLLLAPKGE